MITLEKTYRTVTVTTDHGRFSRVCVYRNTTVTDVLNGLESYRQASGDEFTIYGVETA